MSTRPYTRIVRSDELGVQLVLKGDKPVASIRRLSAHRSTISGGPPYGHWVLVHVSGRVDRHTSFAELRDDALKI